MFKRIYKSIYNHIPFKKNIFIAIKWLITPTPNIYEHLHFRGNFLVKTNEHCSFKVYHPGTLVENEIFWRGIYGNWEKESLKIWTKLAEKSKYIFDIGANTGIYSLVSKSVNPGSQVYAFEPVKRVFKLLKNNIQLNHYNIEPFELALSDYEGTGYFYDPGTEHIYSVSLNKNLLEEHVKHQKVPVKVLRFDTWFRDHQIGGMDLLKIDVEYHEVQVIKGMAGLIRQFRPSILVEILNEDSAQELKRILEDIPYIYFDINEKTGPERITEIKKSSGYNLLLCTVENSKYLRLS